MRGYLRSRRRAIILFFAFILILWGLNSSLTSRVFAQGKANTIRLQSQRVTLRRTGFSPTQIVRPKGPFVLIIENRSGLNQAALRIDRVGKEHVNAASLPRKRALWSSVLDLEPGQYALTEANHPDWVCSFTITAH